MGLFNTFALNSYSYGSYYSSPYSYSYTPSYSSYHSFYAPINFRSSYAPSTYYGVGASYSTTDYSPKSYSYYAPSNYTDTKKFGTLTLNRNTGSLQTKLVNTALSWVGKVNNDREGNRLFSNGRSQAWCADFATYNTKKAFGSKLPSDFGWATRNGVKYCPSQVWGLKYWAEDNDCYLDVASSSNKSKYIAQNVKPGDIMIEKRGGKSHTGIVTKVNSDGSFETVEGNTSNKVATRKYSANSSTLSGFVSLDRYTA